MPGPDFKIAVPKTLVRRVFRTIDAKKRKIATERRADLENAVRRELEFTKAVVETLVPLDVRVDATEDEVTLRVQWKSEEPATASDDEDFWK
jgi:hypothetical protein